MTYGFIITRHVNSETTNQYWNLCIQSIRRFYTPEHKIIVIDDNSNPAFLKTLYNYDYKNINVEIVQSEFPGRGELLPYYYFLKNHYFDNAIIIHDSVFFQQKINFHKFKAHVLPFWHFETSKSDNKMNSIYLANNLRNSEKIKHELMHSDKYSDLTLNNLKWNGCFGVQTFIQYDFLKGLQNKYNIFSLLKVVKTRKERCSLERVMAIIFYIEYPALKNIHSLFGDIYQYGKNVGLKWGYTFQEYLNNYLNKSKRPQVPLVKVWSGR